MKRKARVSYKNTFIYCSIKEIRMIMRSFEKSCYQQEIQPPAWNMPLILRSFISPLCKPLGNVLARHLSLNKLPFSPGLSLKRSK